ncbi:peptide ABC transporter ATP-binding protein [Haladaptatus sp. R4]|uniref:ABC transporter ATP-binding protein n=1 Tax=Haladaptatus sp. R4 TaxID=1679489 RepID=UPI0007B4CEA8|nr:ABC transporter ATP-binding protein [Haladaptatus sp. R4]KZN25500.1 peptide ABC transporter ATP-binding protein [Haladaptatus sp. R4]
MSLLEVENLRTYFYTQSGIVQAVDGVSFEVEKGETIGLVGESGAGKSVTVKSLLGLINPPGKVVDGSVRFDGRELTDCTERELRQEVRGSEISFVFQDPMSALNPVFTVGNQIAEVVEYHTDCTDKEARQRAIELLDDVGIPDPEQRVDQYPHEFSGGMRQRALIAMALSCNPKLIIADEPTTALDVTIQAQILDLFDDIQDKYDTSVVYVTHDMGVVREVCDRVAVMYLGKVVEQAPYEELYRNPKHPYTQALLRSVVRPDQRVDDLNPIQGTVPSAIDPPSGCRFRTRCPVAIDDCSKIEPPRIDVGPNHDSACLLYKEGYGAEEPRLHEEARRGRP